MATHALKMSVKVVTIQQVSGGRDVHSSVYYSTAVQSAITAAPKIHNKHDQRRYSTPRYKQAVRNNVQVVG